MPSNRIWLASGGTAGDLTSAGNWSASTPVANDSARFPANSQAITTNVTGLSNATLSGSLATVIFEDGFAFNVATAATPMKFTATRFEGYFAGGQQFFDLEASNISIRVKAGGGGVGSWGTYIKGSNLVTVDVEGGYVAFAGYSFETATIATIRINGADSNVFIGEGVTLTTLEVTAGTVDLRCAATTVNLYGGTLTTNGTGAITTVNVKGGAFYPNSTGTITTLNASAGITDFTKTGASRTVTTMVPSGKAVVYDDSNAVTWTNYTVPSGRIQVSYNDIF